MTTAELVAAMDVLAPGIGEIIGGSQREEVLFLDNRMDERGIAIKSTTPGIGIYAFATALFRMRGSWAPILSVRDCSTSLAFLKRARCYPVSTPPRKCEILDDL